MKLTEGQPKPTVFNGNMDDCGYKKCNDIARKGHAKEVHDIAKSKLIKSC